MANFLTEGRSALLSVLKGDAQIAAEVKTWFEFGGGLKHRYELEGARCPLLALTPAQAEVEPVANVQRQIPQVLRIELATEGQDAEPAERLVVLLIERLKTCNEERLGLASEGLAAVQVAGIEWEAVPDRTGAALLWTAALKVRLLWRRA